MTALDLDPGRAAKAAEALSDGAVTVERAGRREWRVSSFSGSETYQVRLRPPRCTCPDASYRGNICKHMAVTCLAAGLGGE